MPVRIAYASTYPPIHCGVGEYTRSLASALTARPGVEVVVAAESGVGEPYVDKASGAMVKPSFTARDPSSYSGILDTLSSAGGVDVLHVQHEYGIFGAYRRLLEVVEEAKREGLARKAVITMHTVYHPMAGSVEAIEFQQSLLEAFDAIIVHLPIQSFELQAQDVPVGIVHRIPHGTSVNPYVGVPKGLLAERLGVPKRVLAGFTVVMMGFLRRDKGIDTLLEAVEEAGDSRPNVIVAGEPRDEELARTLREYADRGLIEYIERYLSGDEMLMLAALADAIVLPYRDPPGKYAASGVLHQSMGSLKPVIGTGVPRLSELYQLAPRLVFKPGDSDALARLLRWMSEPGNFDLAIAYASPIYSYAVRTSWPRMARRHLEVYTALLEGRRPSIA